MDYIARPLEFDPGKLEDLSQRLIVSHHENNYAGAVKRLNAIRKQLDAMDWSAAPVFAVTGLKREELIAANSAYLHALFRCTGRRRRTAIERGVCGARARLRFH